MAKVELYYWPPSFYSQRARLALEEKGISYKGNIVVLVEKEQNKEWYLRVNPNGEVPVLKIGNECFTESENIVEIVDKLPSESKSKLVHDLNTPEGKSISEWRKKIDDLPIPVITFGTLAHPELSCDDPQNNIPFYLKSKENMKRDFEATAVKLEQAAQKQPELRESYERKVKLTRERIALFFDKDNVCQTLAKVDNVMKEIESQLQKMSSEHGNEFWLCGKTFTAADINLCILFGRLRLLGLLPRYVDPNKYPIVATYWQRAQTRPAVQKVTLDNMKEVKRLMMTRKLCHYSTVAVGVGAVAAVGWLAYNYIRKA